MGNRIVDDLAGSDAALVTTHGSWVILEPGHVVKIKRPVDFGFLDYSSAEKRRRACCEEVRINRRLAPDVYRGVAPILRTGGTHRIGEPGEPEATSEVRAPDGEVVDWAVVMRRLPEDRRADRLLEEGQLGPGEIDRLADRVARFHRDAATGPGIDEHGTVAAIRGRVEENFDQTAGVLGSILSRAEARDLLHRQRTVLDSSPARFRRRRRRGRVRDGHGDLRLEHVYFERDPDRITIVDGIEFDIAYRAADVAADLGFLAMDLAWRGAASLAERFLARSASTSADPGLYTVIDFWESYRAFVRGKIAALSATDAEVAPAARHDAAEEARRYFLLALAAERRPLVPPMMIAIGGWMGSGKSTLARALADRLSLPIVESDATRKRLFGVEPTTRLHEAPFEGAYSEATSRRVRSRLFRDAAEILASGRSVIVDATLQKRATRRSLRRASRRLGAPLLVVECRVPRAVCRERLQARERHGGATSDGRVEIFDDWIAGCEAFDELSDGEHLVVDTTRPLAHSLDRVLERIPGWPDDAGVVPSDPGR